MSEVQRVESLVYQVKSVESVVYENPPPVEVDTEKWKGCLKNGVLTCHMKVHYSSVAEAREEVERYLRAWEIDAAITHGRGSLKFVYQDAVMVSLASKGEDDARICLVAHDVVTVRAVVKITVKQKNYPSPPRLFELSPDVQALWTRYEGCLDGKEPLLSMAYWCLSMIEVSYGQGNREAAARTLNVDSQVLSTLGRLTSTKGDSAVGRKVPKRGELHALSGAEGTWIEAVIKKLIRRAGEYAGCDDNRALTRVSMQDFPPLK